MPHNTYQTNHDKSHKKHHDKVKALAYQKWVDAGKPEGRDKEFWNEAEQEVLNNDMAYQLATR